MKSKLHFVEYSSAGDNAPVLVLLHGFGGDHHAFFAYYRKLSKHFRVIGFDLPGHGGSVDVGDGEKTGLSAERVWANLDALGVYKICLCGHSLGGAVASLMALKQPERVNALTLIAPGGFGHEINTKPLFRFAAVSNEADIEAIVEQFYGWKYQMSKKVVSGLAKSHDDPKIKASLMRIAEELFANGEQGTLPRKELFGLDIPIKVLWGTQDNITPTRHAHRLPGQVASHVFDGVGHMVHEEVPDAVIQILLSDIRR